MEEDGNILVFNQDTNMWNAESVDSTINFNSNVDIVANTTNINGNLVVHGNVIIDGNLTSNGYITILNNNNLTKYLNIINGKIYINDKVVTNPAKIGLYILQMLDKSQEEDENIINIQQIY